MNKFNFYIATALCCCTVASQSFAARTSFFGKQGCICKDWLDRRLKTNRLLVPAFSKSYYNAFKQHMINKAAKGKYLPGPGEALSIPFSDGIDDDYDDADTEHQDREEKMSAFIDQAIEKGRKYIFFTLSDTHDKVEQYGTITDFIGGGIAKAREKGLIPAIIFSGDIAERGSVKAPRGLGNQRCMDFLESLCGFGCDLYYVLGNHDTQDKEGFDLFINKIRSKNYPNISEHFKLLSNLTTDNNCEPFKDETYNSLFIRYTINGNLLIFPYATCYANGGLAVDWNESYSSGLFQFGENVSRDRAVEDIYTIQGAPFDKSDSDSEDDDPDMVTGEEEEEECKDDTPDDYRQYVANGGDLNLVAWRTMENLRDAISDLGQRNETGPLNIVFAAHDSYVRLGLFLEEFFARYKINPSILERLSFSVAGGHEHSGNHGRYMVKVPLNVGLSEPKDLVAVGHGIYGESVGMIAVQGAESQGQRQSQSSVIPSAQVAPEYTEILNAEGVSAAFNQTVNGVPLLEFGRISESVSDEEFRGILETLRGFQGGVRNLVIAGHTLYPQALSMPSEGWRAANVVIIGGEVQPGSLIYCKAKVVDLSQSTLSADLQGEEAPQILKKLISVSTSRSYDRKFRDGSTVILPGLLGTWQYNEEQNFWGKK